MVICFFFFAVKKTTTVDRCRSTARRPDLHASQHCTDDARTHQFDPPDAVPVSIIRYPRAIYVNTIGSALGMVSTWKALHIISMNLFCDIRIDECCDRLDHNSKTGESLVRTRPIDSCRKTVLDVSSNFAIMTTEFSIFTEPMSHRIQAIRGLIALVVILTISLQSIVSVGWASCVVRGSADSGCCRADGRSCCNNAGSCQCRPERDATSDTSVCHCFSDHPLPAVPSEGESSLSLKLLDSSIDGLVLITTSPLQPARWSLDASRHPYGVSHRLNAVLCVWQT